jgi:hypothetical protein
MIANCHHLTECKKSRDVNGASFTWAMSAAFDNPAFDNPAFDNPAFDNPAFDNNFPLLRSLRNISLITSLIVK